MADYAAFQRRQLEFAAHIRDPAAVAAPPGIDDRRMAVYRELFFNNLRNLLATMFPVLRKLHSDERWRHLVREFMRVHRARTPYFLQLPREFVEFLQTEYASGAADLPFLAELAHYEYAELEVSIDTGKDALQTVDEAGDLLDGVPLRTVASRVYGYRWPVHRIGPDFRPGEAAAEPVWLAVYRARDDKVRFLELNPVTAALLDRIGDNPVQKTGAAILRELAGEVGYADEALFLAHGRDMLAGMRDLGLVLGSRANRD